MSFIFQRQILEDFFVEKALFSARSVHVYLQILFCPLDKIRSFFDLMETNSYLTAVEQYNLHWGKTQRNTKRENVAWRREMGEKDRRQTNDVGWRAVISSERVGIVR